MILKFKKVPKISMKIRIKVFVDEQGFVDEFDEIDNHSYHLVFFKKLKPVGTCRFFLENDYYIIGRLAVLKEYRGKKIGSILLNKACKEIEKLDGRAARLHAQLQAKDFYGKNGFVQISDIELEQGCPHIWMEKNF